MANLVGCITLVVSMLLSVTWRHPKPWQSKAQTLDRGLSQENEMTSREIFEAITRGVPDQPFQTVLTEGTNGGLELGLNPGVLPILASIDGVFLATARLGKGRIVAFSGQDFLSSDSTSSFIGQPHNDALVRNAVRWASGMTPQPRILVDNPAIAKLLLSGGWKATQVAKMLPDEGLTDELEARDWTAAALAKIDVAVVLVNQWDLTHVDQSGIGSLRSYVEQGGGLVIGGSSYHWSGEDPELFPANLICSGSGLRWHGEEVPDLAGGRLRLDALASSPALWQAYLNANDLNEQQLARLPSLFRAALGLGRTDELDRALERLIAETPELPASSSDPLARLSAEVAASLGAHAWPSAHPWAAAFPGLPTAKAERVTRSIALDLRWTGARPLGLYAPPGELLTLELAATDLQPGMWISVGDDHDDLRASDFEHWARAPTLGRGTRLTSTLTKLSNPYGGALYLINPRSRTGSIELRVSGALPMAIYTLGESKMADWKRDLELGAPQALLQARGRMRILVPSSAAKEVEYPDWVLEFWSEFHASHSELSGEPLPRTFESHWIFDPQVGSGYANASPVASSWYPVNGVDRIVFPLKSVPMALTTDSGEDNYWTIGHELGHQFQTDDWTGGDLTEVCVNLFSLYTQNGQINGGGEFETVGFEDDFYDHAALIDFRWDEAGDWEKLQLYRQLVLVFGWKPFKRTFASYYLPEFPREIYGSHIDGFAIRFSKIIQRDLTGFLKHWEYPLSEAAVDRIQSFGFPAWMPPGW